MLVLSYLERSVTVCSSCRPTSALEKCSPIPHAYTREIRSQYHVSRTEERQSGTEDGVECRSAGVFAPSNDHLTIVERKLFIAVHVHSNTVTHTHIHTRTCICTCIHTCTLTTLCVGAASKGAAGDAQAAAQPI